MFLGTPLGFPVGGTEGPLVSPNIDNYKTKIARTMVQTPLDLSLGTLLGKMMWVVTTVDNEIGGLFGQDDFLPNDPKGVIS